MGFGGLGKNGRMEYKRRQGVCCVVLKMCEKDS